MLRAFGPDQVIEPWQLDAENLSIEEEQRIEGLVLRGRRDSLTNRERREKGRDSTAPISPGWRLPWKRMYRRIQATYAFSVRRLPWRV